MSNNTAHKISNPQSFSNYLSTILSLFVMLYLLGVGGLIVVYTNQLMAYAKDNISFYIELKDDANEASVFTFQKKLETYPYASPKTVEYISKEKALEILTKDGSTKEEMMPFGENMLPNMLQFKINPDYAGDYDQVVQEIKANDFVDEVFYTETPTDSIVSRVYLLKIILSLLMVFFIFVVIVLLQSKLKLLLSANRSAIQVMQIAGATQGYISKPYMIQSLKNGLLCGIMAVVALWGTRFLFEDGLDTQVLNMEIWVVLLSVMLILIGVLFPWLFTRFTVFRYLSKPLKEWDL